MLAASSMYHIISFFLFVFSRKLPHFFIFIHIFIHTQTVSEVSYCLNSANSCVCDAEHANASQRPVVWLSVFYFHLLCDSDVLPSRLSFFLSLISQEIKIIYTYKHAHTYSRLKIQRAVYTVGNR